MISGNANGNSEKLGKISAMIIKNLIVTPATHESLRPYEKDIFIICSADRTTYKILSGVLTILNQDSLKRVKTEKKEETKKKKNLRKIHDMYCVRTKYKSNDPLIYS